ncbi:hypothetical protein ACFPFP_31720 [Bradyrhizobium sp. GCM10023182]|uniref:Uncharacterized protein n=1 Tax=Bradyrhizobium zhengyangense TaxID=2911009 RepID=A0ABS9LX35_9BRAD|nr:hypothetical protein [Bradyrhizobium zhengyangense]MCG2671508.1 hypothetical protein [Bradyrhizobium zhengyangense]
MQVLHDSHCPHWDSHRAVGLKRKRNQPGMFGIALSILRGGDTQKPADFRGESSLVAETCGMP